MAEAKDTVDFYWDAVCPWCWITSRWMVDVGRQKAIQVNWKVFSLKKINEGREMPERFRVSHTIGLRALRVAAAVRQAYGNEVVGKFYTVMGTRRHHDQRRSRGLLLHRRHRFEPDADRHEPDRSRADQRQLRLGRPRRTRLDDRELHAARDVHGVEIPLYPERCRHGAADHHERRRHADAERHEQ